MHTPSDDMAAAGSLPAGALAAPASSPELAHWRMAEHWPELVQAVTEQAVETADLLRRGLELLAQRGKLSAAELQVLLTPALRLKQCGIHAQQIVRFQSGMVRQSHEKIDLAWIAESVLQERSAALAQQGVSVRRKCAPCAVQIDPTLGYTLVQAMLDWGLKLGQHLDLRLELSPSADRAARARLCLRIHAAPMPARADVLQDSIQWLLLRQIAATDGAIELRREVSADGVDLIAWFKRVLAAQPTQPEPLPSCAGMVATFIHSVSSAYVLVCSAAPEVRQQALAIIRHLGVQADAVASAAQAAASLREREVHLLILDREHPPEDSARLHYDLAALYPDQALLHLVRPPATVVPATALPATAAAPSSSAAPGLMQQVLQVQQVPQVRLDEIDHALGPAVMFALSSQM